MIIPASALRYWSKSMAHFTFESEQAARNEVFRICENHSRKSWHTQEGQNTIPLNRKFANAMPLYKEDNSWKVGLKEYLSNMTSDFSDGTNGEPATSGPDPGSIDQVGLPDYKYLERLKRRKEKLKALIQRRDPDGIEQRIGESVAQPFIAYHSSPYSFRKFDTSKEGAHFGNYEQAVNLRKVGKKSPKAYLLNITNPLRMQDIGGWNHFSNFHANLHRMDAITDEEANEAWQAWNRSDDEGWETLKQILKRKGFDGIVYENEQEGPGDSYIAFWPDQIKPAPREAEDFEINPYEPDDETRTMEEWRDRLNLVGLTLEMDGETGALTVTNPKTGHYLVYNEDYNLDAIEDDFEVFTSVESFEKQWNALFSGADFQILNPEDDLNFD